MDEEEWKKKQMQRSTKGEMAVMMGDILKTLKFTTETQEEFNNGRLPTLDTELRSIKTDSVFQL